MPRVQQLYLHNRLTLPALGIITIQVAKAHRFGRWQPGHQVTTSVSHPDYINLS